MHVSPQWPFEHPKCSNLGIERPSEGNQVPVHSSELIALGSITKEKVIDPYWVEGRTLTHNS